MVYTRFKMKGERRDSQRLESELAVWVRKPGHTFTRSKTLDVSDTGLRLEYDDDNLTFGEELHLTLQLPEGELVSLSGRAVWRRPSGQIGLAFNELSKHAGRLLGRLLPSGRLPASRRLGTPNLRSEDGPRSWPISAKGIDKR